LSRENEQDFGKKSLCIFVDANTLVSALIFEGNEALLLKLGAIGACTLVNSRYVLDEVARVLQRREFRIRKDELPSLLQFVNKAVLVREDVGEHDLERCYSRLDDKKDVHVLAAFEKFKCDLLVTGNGELLTKVKGAKTTRQALERILGERSERSRRNSSTR
jgi:predicted nucleic acid-binding protein